ncbi:hypothetical protein [Streptomyces sp. NPDC058092]|uniref:hypothetical protein n=1 Tax=Streptomyces sp. NPDC058092 TaxID=3346336 RepID=UPI0036EE79C7
MHPLTKPVTVLSAALFLGSLATVVPASASQTADVQTVTATYDCGSYGTTDLTIHASAASGVGSVKISTSAGLAPVDIPANSITATLRLARAAGGTVSFSGTANDAAAAGRPVVIGALTGSVAAGDSLDSYIPAAGSGDASLSLNILGTANTCVAVSKQSPGPIVF